LDSRGLCCVTAGMVGVRAGCESQRRISFDGVGSPELSQNLLTGISLMLEMCRTRMVCCGM